MNEKPIPSSELIINDDGSVFHLHILPEDLADTVIMMGDPKRVNTVAQYFETIEVSKQSREFVTVTGTYKGKRVTAMSHGIGTDNIDIVMTELDALANINLSTREVKPEHRRLTVLRIGTCGAIQPDIPIGAFIFSEISVGCDGLLNWYADRDGVSLLDMEEAFKKHVKWDRHLPDPYFVKASPRVKKLFEGYSVMGVTISAPGFYGPQGRVLRIPLAMPDMLEDFESFRYGDYRITNFEMEGSALAGLAAKLGHDAGTICCAIANRYLKDADTDYKSMVRNLIELSLNRLTQE